MRRSNYLIIRRVILLVVLIISAILSRGMVTPANPTYTHLRMGNPSKAAASNKDNYLMKKRYFAISYNNSKGTPNWVSWRLAASDIGHAPREEFYPDEDLPVGFKVVTPSDYTGSGFDRGHMCPHSDRSANSTMSRATFVMTNIIPQSPNLNQKAWEQLESYCRSLAKSGKTLYIVSGPYGKGGAGRFGESSIIGENNVVVPSKCWKVIMVLNRGSDDPRKVTSKTRLIAVIMPNNMSVGDDWARYRFSVAVVEKMTGYKFFDSVPSRIIDPLKKKVDKVTIPPPEPIQRGQ